MIFFYFEHHGNCDVQYCLPIVSRMYTFLGKTIVTAIVTVMYTNNYQIVSRKCTFLEKNSNRDVQSCTLMITDCFQDVYISGDCNSDHDCIIIYTIDYRLSTDCLPIVSRKCTFLEKTMVTAMYNHVRH